MTLYRKLQMLGALFLLTACALTKPTSTPTTASAAIEPNTVMVRVPDPTAACAVFRPVYWSKSDTPATVVAVKANNAAGKSLCGPKWK